jgi:hypothetical protein
MLRVAGRCPRPGRIRLRRDRLKHRQGEGHWCGSVRGRPPPERVRIGRRDVRRILLSRLQPKTHELFGIAHRERTATGRYRTPRAETSPAVGARRYRWRARPSPRQVKTGDLRRSRVPSADGRCQRVGPARWCRGRSRHALALRLFDSAKIGGGGRYCPARLSLIPVPRCLRAFHLQVEVQLVVEFAFAVRARRNTMPGNAALCPIHLSWCRCSTA